MSKCAQYDEQCDCRACRDDRWQARLQRSKSIWRVGSVEHGYAPVDQSGVASSGWTPSHDRQAIQQAVDRLNQREYNHTLYLMEQDMNRD